MQSLGLSPLDRSSDFARSIHERAARVLRGRRLVELRDWIHTWSAACPLGYVEVDYLRGSEYLTPSELRHIVEWSFANRDGRRGEVHSESALTAIQTNSHTQVRTATTYAFKAADATDALDLLNLLDGVGSYIGTSILTVQNPDRFLRFTNGAWRALSRFGLLGDQRRNWRDFLIVSRMLAAATDTDLRMLDRAFLVAECRAGVLSSSALGVNDG